LIFQGANPIFNVGSLSKIVYNGIVVWQRMVTQSGSFLCGFIPRLYGGDVIKHIDFPIPFDGIPKVTITIQEDRAHWLWLKENYGEENAQNVTRFGFDCWMRNPHSEDRDDDVTLYWTATLS
jgi:hypothetical protein